MSRVYNKKQIQRENDDLFTLKCLTIAFITCFCFFKYQGDIPFICDNIVNYSYYVCDKCSYSLNNPGKDYVYVTKENKDIANRDEIIKNKI